MYLDTTVYNPDNLNQIDKRINDELTDVKNEVLSEEVLEEYLAEKYGNAYFTACFLKEHLEPFIDFLKTKFDYCICDRIIDSIESYSDEEYEMIVKKNQLRKEKQQ